MLTYDKDSSYSILKVHNSDEYGNDECMYAFVEYTKDLLDKVLLAQKALRDLIKQGTSAYVIEMWDYRVTWLSRAFFDEETLEDLLGEPEDGKEEEEIGIKEDIRPAYERWLSSVEGNDSISIFSTDCNTIKVRHDSFFWECCQKNTSTYFNTSGIYITDLEKNHGL